MNTSQYYLNEERKKARYYQKQVVEARSILQSVVGSDVEDLVVLAERAREVINDLLPADQQTLRKKDNSD